MSRRGCTLVEALVFAALAVLALGLALQLLRWSTGASSRVHAQLHARERACHALLELRLALSDATALAAPGGLALVFTAPAGDGEVRLDVRAGRLEARWPGRRAFTALIPSGVRAFRVTPVGPGTVHVLIELARRGEPLLVTDEVLAPAIAQRVTSEPWNPVE